MELKKLQEQRAELQSELLAILDAAKAEERAMSDEENAKFDELEKQIKAIDNTIEKEERARNMEIKKPLNNDKKEDIEVVERRSFEAFIRQKCGLPVELRAGEQNVTMGNNGAIVPTSIANKIISAVEEMCPILEKATVFHSKGTLKIPVWGLSNTSHDITVAFADEFTELTADSGKFTSVDLSGFLVGALTLVGKSVINNTEIDVVNFVVQEMAKKIALFLEGKLLNGEDTYNAGALSTTNNLNAGSTSAISADNLIDLQAMIPTVYQANCAWTMAPATFTAIKKIKDGNGQYLLLPDFAGSTPYQLLGKPVYVSDNMPAIGSGNKAVLYGDFSGLGVNFREGIEIQVLMEKYSTQHAVGVVSWFEFDSDVIDHQKLATLTMSAL